MWVQHTVLVSYQLSSVKQHLNFTTTFRSSQNFLRSSFGGWDGANLHSPPVFAFWASCWFVDGLLSAFNPHFSSGGSFEDFIGGKCVFREDQWSNWNGTVKTCLTNVRDSETPQTCMTSSTNITGICQGACQNKQELKNSKSTTNPVNAL